MVRSAVLVAVVSRFAWTWPWEAHTEATDTVTCRISCRILMLEKVDVEEESNSSLEESRGVCWSIGLSGVEP
jgi:hypothetical protein